MRVEYDTTIEEIADACMRAYSRAAKVAYLRRRGALWTAALTGVIGYLLLANMGALSSAGLMIGGVGVAVAAGGYWLDFYKSMRRRIEKGLKEQMQTGGPTHFAVQLNDDCIWTKQGATQVSYDWGNLKEVVDAGDAIELQMRDGGFVVIRNKAFNDAQQRESFLRSVKERQLTTMRT